MLSNVCYGMLRLLVHWCENTVIAHAIQINQTCFFDQRHYFELHGGSVTSYIVNKRSLLQESQPRYLPT